MKGKGVGQCLCTEGEAWRRYKVIGKGVGQCLCSEGEAWGESLE